jgi:hypothetical protein
MTIIIYRKLEGTDWGAVAYATGRPNPAARDWSPGRGAWHPSPYLAKKFANEAEAEAQAFRQTLLLPKGFISGCVGLEYVAEPQVSVKQT